MVDIYETEQEQIDALKRWWDDNGRSIIIGLVLGVCALLAWNGWQSYMQKRNESASLNYFKIVQAVENNKTEQSQNLVDELVEKYGGTHYASLAQMMGAKVDAENNNVENAIKRLQWVVAKGKQDAFKDIARLRLAELYLSQSDLSKATSVLSGVKGQSFASQADELKGDVALAEGDVAKAKSFYDLALPQATNKLLLQMKLDNLGVSDAE